MPSIEVGVSSIAIIRTNTIRKAVLCTRYKSTSLKNVPLHYRNKYKTYKAISLEN